MNDKERAAAAEVAMHAKLETLQAQYDRLIVALHEIDRAHNRSFVLQVDIDSQAVADAVEGVRDLLPAAGDVCGTQPKRSRTLLKVKSWHDAEAVVVGHVPGKGKHKGRLGALRCTTGGRANSPPAMWFELGTGFSDAQREAPPAIGSIVTFKYQELTPAGVPRFPVFVAERNYE